MLQFRYVVPPAPAGIYLVDLDNIVPMRGGGTSYQVEIHVDAPDGELLYAGKPIARDHDFAAEDLSRLDATALLTDVHHRQGYVDLWATVHAEGDQWTAYRDSDDGPWDLYALVPDPGAFARWEETQQQRAEMLRRGALIIPWPQRIELRKGDFGLGRELNVVIERAYHDLPLIASGRKSRQGNADGLFRGHRHRKPMRCSYPYPGGSLFLKYSSMTAIASKFLFLSLLLYP